MTAAPRVHWADCFVGLAIWVLASLFALINLGPMRLVIDMDTRPQDYAQISWNTSGDWKSAPVETMPLVQPWNQAIFTLPVTALHPELRLEPAVRGTPYHVDSIAWERAGLTSRVPLRTVTHPGSTASISTAGCWGDCILRGSFDGGAGPVHRETPFIVPRAPLRFVISGLALALLLPFAGAVAWVALLRRKITCVSFAQGMILGVLACYAYILYRYGPSGAIFDDWRYVLDSSCNLVDGGWQWLDCSSNDTYYLTNQVADFLLLRISNVDYRWVRTFGFLLLVLQVVLQFRLLGRSCTGRSWICAAAIGLCIWSLGSSAYWGTTALAYQQAIPTLCGSAMLVLLVRDDGYLHERVGVVPVVLIAIASGLSYISGPIMVLALAAAVVAVTLPARRVAGRLFRFGWMLAGVGLLLLALQVGIVWRHQGSLLEHTHAAASVYPNDHRFWLFFMALFGRAAGYAGTSRLIDGFFTLLFLCPGLIAIASAWRGARSGTSRHALRALTLLSVYACVGAVVYASAVAFGRSGMVGSGVTAASVVAYAKSRFHYWPIAALLPYAWLGWVRFADGLSGAGRRALLAFSVAAFLVPKSPVALHHLPALDAARYVELSGARCIVAHDREIDSGTGVHCPIITGVDVDIGPTLRKLRDRNARLYRLLETEGAPANAKR